LDDIGNREAYERDLRAYQESQREAALITTPVTVSGTGQDEPPRIARRSNPATSTQSDDRVIETAIPQMRLPDGIRIEGVLIGVDCSGGLTLRVAASNGTIELHTDAPEQLEFVSYIPSEKDTIACGTTDPPLRVAIVYKRTPIGDSWGNRSAWTLSEQLRNEDEISKSNVAADVSGHGGLGSGQCGRTDA
jgi:hypothetical protein